MVPGKGSGEVVLMTEEQRIAELESRTTKAEQRIVDVIAELERRCDGAGDAGDYVAQSLYSEAISLLKNGVKKDGA